MTELTFKDVTKVFEDNVVAVEDLNMQIHDGEFLVIVGPSGCGKTTTLRMVAGLDTVTDGELRLGSSLINSERPQDRDVAMVFQSYALYPHMTARRNMAFGLEQSTDLSSEKIDERVEQATNMMGISDLLDRKPGELSGGQQQRIALGRAIVRDPEVFLMDEPLANLDARLRAQMRTELQQIQEELDVTTIYVTHDQTEAMTMSDRIAILNDGRLQQIGTPLECYYEPNNQFVAGFIGEPSMNFLNMSRENTQLYSEGFKYHLPETIATELGSKTDITLGIRPEDITVIPSPERSNDFTAEINVTETFGKEHNLYLILEDGRFDDMLVATLNGRQRFDEGEQVGVRLSPDTIHLFDGNDGTALWNPATKEEETSMSLTE